jgi:hypothetical protein
VLDEEKQKTAPITVVINTSPYVRDMSDEEFKRLTNAPTKPSWVDAEIVQENQPIGRDKV